MLAASQFELPTGRRISVAQFFAEQYGVSIRDTNLPCIRMGGGGKVLLPPEVCQVLPKQRYGRVLTGDQTTGILRHATQRPVDKQRQLLNTVGQQASWGVLGCWGGVSWRSYVPWQRAAAGSNAPLRDSSPAQTVCGMALAPRRVRLRLRCRCKPGRRRSWRRSG